MKKYALIILVVVLALCLAACSGAAQESSSQPPVETAAPQVQATPEPVQSEPAPEVAASTGGLMVAQKVQTGSGVTVKSAADWSSEYADVYASYMKNSENSGQDDYVAKYPMIAVLYEGMGFSKFYNSARGHVYTVEDLTSTGRPHALANCFSCKTPDFTAAVNELGAAAYTIPFEDMLQNINEPISCYNCHANTVPNIVITHSYLSSAMGDDFESVDARTLACAQCHVEYYFDPQTKEVVLPYSGVGSMNPDDILNYYNSLLVEGAPFSDYTNPRSGVRQIKLQHSEFETYMGTGSVHAGTFTCADCHMGTGTGTDGSAYKSHNWISPLENDALLQGSCAACHPDLKSQVDGIQEDVSTRVKSVGELLVDITEKLVTAVDSGDYSEDELNSIRDIMRNSQFYWDFVFVENGGGAHNSRLANQCLDKAEALANEALLLFK